ncbi:hypothetical protein ZWY2020_051839 [Hordeum vulgare]|nr:hypothetical protein ZWY2020_051839 [Hordeum vulgare]
MARGKAARGDTSVVVVVLETNEVYVVVSLSTAGDTQVICVDPTTGALRHQGKQGEDLFESEAAALNHITNGSRFLSKSTTYAKAALGYAALGSYALLLAMTQLSATVPRLPGGGCVYTVVETQWVKIQLQNPQPQGNGELKNIKDLADLDIDGKYYFCETRDITRPCPSRMASPEPEEEYVWNAWVSRPSGTLVLSRPSGCMLKPVPCITPMADGGSSLLSFKKKDLVWVCQQGADYVELFIYLGEPCHVSQLLLTVSHGVEDSSYPATVDVRVGSSIDALKLVVEVCLHLAVIFLTFRPEEPVAEVNNHVEDCGSTQFYLEFLESLSRDNKGKSLNFEQMMKLEIKRLYLDLSAAERDRALLSIDSSVCKSCCNEMIKQALYVDYVRFHHSMRRKGRMEKAALKAVNQVCQLEPNRITDSVHNVQSGQRQLKQLLDDEESLAEFPHASFLHTVETADDSAPLFSLLAPLGSGVHKSYWKAPQGNTSVEFPIVLGGISDVSGVAIIVSSCGYSTSDCPIVEIWASNKIQRDDRTFIGKWDVQSMIVSSPQLYGPEKSGSLDEAPRHFKLHFPNPIRCRIISIKMTLPQIGSSSTKFNEDFDDLLSLDESSFIDSKANNSHNSFIHAKRIVVFGSSLPKEMGPDTSVAIMRMRSFVDGSPSLGRFRIPVEAERLRDHDLVLEQYLLPNSPGIAGFRLDSFGVIRPRVTHSPLPSELDMKECSLIRMEDRHLNPAILHIQVTVVKESGKLVVEEYRLPEVKANTPLYFDFSDLQQDARYVIFRLLGDVTAFVDDIAEIEGLNLRNLPLASGLSLSNKVKLYYYADTYEMGKIGSLSAV